jgi:iron-sulfur cluster repair protein YtfE (RIC family)
MRPQIQHPAITRTYFMTLRSLMQAGPAKANELFAKLSETSDGAVKTRERLFAELKAELEFHTSLEEQHLFPVLRRNPETKELVADAIRDNKELHAKVSELDGMAKNDAIFSERRKRCTPPTLLGSGGV